MVVEPVRHRFTVEDYHHMSDAGMFPPDQRLELIAGEVIEMAAIGSRHAGAVNRLTRLFACLGDRAIVAVQNPVRLGDLSEPQPDLTLLRWRSDFYEAAHPTPADVLLLIEVSDSTMSWDRTVKQALYAAAGITEMWDVGLRGLEVATDPGPDGYCNLRPVGPGGHVTPLAFPDLTLAAVDLLG